MLALTDSPFFRLGATIHDDRRQIYSLAEERSLELDEDICQKDRLELTNPRKRIVHEIRWLPGVSKGMVNELLRLSEEEPFRLLNLESIPKITQFNLLTASLRFLNADTEQDKIVELITTIDFVSTRLFPIEVTGILNEERSLSGFPKIESEDIIENELRELVRECVTEIIGLLDRLQSVKLISVMTDVAEISTVNGTSPANTLVDSLVDRYELEVREHLVTGASNIDDLIESIEEQSEFGEEQLQPYIDELEQVTRNWDKIAQPIQVSTKSRGLEHKQSQEIAYNIRSLAIRLFNGYSMLDTVRHLTNILTEVFAEVPDVVEKLEEDIEIISDITSNRQ